MTNKIVHRATLTSLNFRKNTFLELAQYRSIEASTIKYVESKGHT